MEREHIQPSGRTKEHQPSFEKVIEGGVNRALALLNERFGTAENPIDGFTFHNVEHTKSVIARVKKLLEAMGANERVAKLGEFAAAYHDSVQNYEVKVSEDGTKTRKRFVEKNENASAEEALIYMRENPELFTEEDMEIVQAAIEATIPDFDMTNKTVIQPHLLSSLDAAATLEDTMTDMLLVMRAVALADLGAAGMDEPDVFATEGDKLFREDNIDMYEALQHPELLSDSQKESFKKRMLDWTAGQVVFAQGREALLKKELQGLPGEAERNVHALFTNFNANIQRAYSKIDRRKLMSFEELSRDFGYAV